MALEKENDDMFTPYGKLVRKHRIENGQKLKDMADYLGVKSSYISAIETGKKAVPVELADKVADFLELDKQERAELLQLANQSRSRINIPLQNATQKQRELATAFSRKFDDLTVKEVDRLMKVLGKG